eukprot:14224989-Alexandrium_andersonii.AAC.1
MAATRWASRSLRGAARSALRSRATIHGPSQSGHSCSRCGNSAGASGGMYIDARQSRRPALSRAVTATAYPATGAASCSLSHPAGRATATPPGCRGPSAPTMDAMVRAPGSTTAHSAAAYACQCASCSRHGRPRS